MVSSEVNKLIDGVKSRQVTGISPTLFSIGGLILTIDLFLLIFVFSAVSDLAIITSTLWFLGLAILGSVFITGGAIVLAIDKK